MQSFYAMVILDGAWLGVAQGLARLMKFGQCRVGDAVATIGQRGDHMLYLVACHMYPNADARNIANMTKAIEVAAKTKQNAIASQMRSQRGS